MKRTSLKVVRAVAVGAVVSIAALTAYLADTHPSWGPMLTPLAAGLSGLIGKAIGVPLRGVLEAALQAMRPEEKETIAIGVLGSMPPPAAQRIIASIQPKTSEKPGEVHSSSGSTGDLVEFLGDTEPPPPAAKD